MYRALVFLIVSYLPAAWAQLDSSSAVLLRPSGKSVAPENLDSSRYKVRAPESKKDDDDLDEKPGSYIPSPVQPRAKSTKKPAASNAAAAPQPAPPPQAPAIEPGLPSVQGGMLPAAPAAAPAEGTPPPVTAQVKELILGGSAEEIDEYNAKIHPQDPRANVLSISFAPAYYYQGSASEYSFRRYTSNGPGFGAGMNLWFTPFFGIQSKYFSSVTGSVKSGTNSMVPMEVTTFEAGVRFRKHFGYTRKAARLSWGLDYHDAKDKISRDSTNNIGRSTSGLSLALEGEVPASNTYAHTFEVSVRPRQHHSERSTTSEARSGTRNETNALSLGLGGQWVLDRRNQVFWKTHYSVERNLYAGEASEIDPHTDAAPGGVSVTNSLVIFYFGFRWGS